jgi:hypothetical protein
MPTTRIGADHVGSGVCDVRGESVLVERACGKQLVIAFFASHAAAAVAERVVTDEAREAGRPGTVGALALNAGGEIEAPRLGEQASPEGPGVGAVLGVIAMAIVGGVLPGRGHLFDADSDLSTDDVARIGAELDAGAAAVAVLEAAPRAEQAVVRLAGLGGRTEMHRMTHTALRQAAYAPRIRGR